MKPFIATPCYGGKLEALYVQSLLGLVHVMTQRGIPHDVRLPGKHSLIHRARNHLAHAFLKTDCTHLVFLDADIAFQPEDLLDMLATGKDVVGGVYPMKTIDWTRVRRAALSGHDELDQHTGRFVVNPTAVHLEDGSVAVDHGCIEVKDIGTGFLSIARHVLEEMAIAYPELLYVNDTPGPEYGQPGIGFFNHYIEPETRRDLSEDYAFCRRWQAMGGKVHAYLPAKLTHIGSYPFKGDVQTLFPALPEADAVTEWSDIEALPKDDRIRRLHEERYEWAAWAIKGAKRIANAACGTNYGAPILGVKGREVTGFDRGETQAQVAKARGRGDVVLGDLQGQTFDGFDALVCIETLEHLERPWDFLRGLSGTVRELVVSVPIIPTKHVNPFHLHDFTAQEVKAGLNALGWVVLKHEVQCHDVGLFYAVRPQQAVAAE